MEFVGKTIKKESKGIGVVKSFDSSTNLFEILFEDGDSGQLGEMEIEFLVVERNGGLGTVKPFSTSRVRENNPEQYHEGQSALDLAGGFDLNAGGFNTEEEEEITLKRTSLSIDLNVDANGKFDKSMTKNTTDSGVSAAKRECCFDLNMGLDEEMMTLDEMKEGENSFHIPHVVKEAQKQEMVGGSDSKECAEMVGGSDSKECAEMDVGSDSKDIKVWFDASEGAHSGDDIVICSYRENVEGDMCSDEIGKRDCTSSRIGSKVGVIAGVVYHNGFVPLEDQLKEGRLEACTPPVSHNKENSPSTGTERKLKRRKKLSDSANSGAETTLRRSRRLATVSSSSVGTVENVQKQICDYREFVGHVTPGDVDAMDLINYEGKFSENGTPLDHSYQDSGITRRGRKRRKRIEVLGNGSFDTDTPSRRTSHRLVAAISLDKEAQSPVAIGEVAKELFTTSDHQEYVGYNILPPKPKLPPSSDNLNLDGIPVLDLFSVYTCLRSFSTLLFLSPFNLEDFVAALKCDKANMLFDSIHVSLLQTLRKHLELLSNEDILSASNCLRNLNWDLLDSITWPAFVANYLLTHGSALKADFDVGKLMLLDSEYYKLSAVVKIEILRCLCDDVIEVEAIRLELNRRTYATDPNIDIDQNLKTITAKKRRIARDVASESCLTEELIGETADWNSDDCCLCKMDGNLICCDGCPAAYHMKCVGVANNSLPDGEWYCPECLIEKDKPWLKMGKLLRGAEIIGVDPYERLYYVSAGYLLVLDSCGSESSCHYYHRNDLSTLIEAMKLSNPLYIVILKAISKHFDFFVSPNGTKGNMSSHSSSVCLEVMKGQISTTPEFQHHVAPSESGTGEESLGMKHPINNSLAAQISDNMECNYLAMSEKMENLLTSSEGSFETSQVQGIQDFPTAGSVVLTKKSVATSKDSEFGTILTTRDFPLTPGNLNGESQNCTHLQEYGHMSHVTKVRRGEGFQGQLRTRYINHYIFAHTSSMVLEELSRKSADKNPESSTKSVEDIISAQLKAISKRSTKFFWPMFQNLDANAKKEKCGWCFACSAPDADDGSSRDCFFHQNVSYPKGFDELAGLRLRHCSESHLVDVICYILCMEDRLRGLLLGPWQDPQYTKLWRQRVVEASDVALLKYFLLMLEANMHRLVLSPEWIKHVDSVTMMGSASHIVTRMSSIHGIGRKRARCSDIVPKPSLSAASGLGLLWWRGGRLSRELFNWKGLPRALASKAARQAGCTKVPGVLYSESSDFTKRSRSIAWKSAVEASRSVEQLALQVRELDAHIKWDDIENTHPLLKMDQYKNSMRSFKKVIIRKKLTEGTLVKYLLDFGKRRFIPDIVVTHGSVVEESSSGRKKYWLEDTHVPLHLLKAFEEKRIARKDNKMNCGKHHWSDRIKERTSKRKGFSYLFAKAEQSKYCQCGHCNKDVLIRESVCCMYCKGHFHKRHVKKSPRSAAAECTFSCYKCPGGKLVKVGTKKGKKPVSLNSKNSSDGSRLLRPKLKKKIGKAVKPAQNKKNKKIDSVAVVPLRRSPRKLKSAALPNRRAGKRQKGKAKGKKVKSTSNVSKRPKRSVWQKKRTQAIRAFWLNGIQFSRKANDERVVLFKCKSLVTPSSLPSVSMVSPPKCGLSCEQAFTPSLSYVSCEICGDWFHGDAFGLTMEKMDRIIGFRCHKCRDRTSPICPHLLNKNNNEAKLGEVKLCNEDGEIRIPSLDGQCNHGDQEHRDISSSIPGQSNVENSMLFVDDKHKKAVECSKDVDDFSSENRAVPMETNQIGS